MGTSGDLGLVGTVASVVGPFAVIVGMVFSGGRLRQSIEDQRKDLDGLREDVKSLKACDEEHRRALHGTELVQQEHEGRLRVLEAAHAETTILRREWYAWREILERNLTEVLTIVRQLRERP